MHPVTEHVTQRIVERSRRTRADYLARMDAAAAADEGPARLRLAQHSQLGVADDDQVHGPGLQQARQRQRDAR